MYCPAAEPVTIMNRAGIAPARMETALLMVRMRRSISRRTPHDMSPMCVGMYHWFPQKSRTPARR
jgi:hypothetical protein